MTSRCSGTTTVALGGTTTIKEAAEAVEAVEAVEAECSEQDRRGRVRFACLIMTKSNPARFFLWVALLFDF